MGEIRIKSGNLYPIQIGEDTWGDLNNATHSNNNGELVVVMSAADNNSGVYSPSGSTIRAVHKDLSTYSWSVEIKADSPASLIIGFEGDEVKYLNITTEYQKFTFSNQSFTSDRAFIIYNRSGVVHTVYLRNFMLNEGSTALPYQPYFLNRPAHQVTNGQFVDIPTHHYTNNRWQGELTSQSPLKFWADGEMLDWRVEGKTSGNLCERYTPVVTAQQYSASLYMFADIQPSTTYTIAFEIDEGSLQYFNENLFTYSQYYVTGTGNKQILRLNTKANIQKTASTWSDTYGWIFAKNYTGNATVPHWKKIQLLEGTYTPSTIPPYEPYGGVGDWDETEQRYVIPVTINGTTTNIFTDHQLMGGDSIDYTTTETTIPLATGNNTLTIDTAVQPKSVFVKFEG